MYENEIEKAASTVHEVTVTICSHLALYFSMQFARQNGWVLIRVRFTRIAVTAA